MNPRTLAMTLALGLTVTGVAGAQSRLFFNDNYGGQPLLTSTDADGLNPLILLPSQASDIHDNGAAVDARDCRLYYAQDDVIRRCRFDGSGVEDVLDDPGFGFVPRQVVLDPDNDRMFWISPGRAERIAVADMEGQNPQVLVNYNDVVPQVLPLWLGLDVAGGKMYWYDSAITGYRRANLDGTGIETVFDKDIQVMASTLDVAGGDLYFFSTGRALCRVPMSGGTETLLFTYPGSVGDNGLAIDHDADRLYFTSANDLVWTPFSTPGSSFQTQDLGLHVAPVLLALNTEPPLAHAYTPNDVNVGDSFTMSLCGTKPATTFGLFATAVNGAPVWYALLFATTDPGGEFAMAATAPAALSGITLTTQVLGFAPGWGAPRSSNPATLIVR